MCFAEVHMSFREHCEQYVNNLKTLTFIILSILKEIIEPIKVEFLFIYCVVYFLG